MSSNKNIPLFDMDPKLSSSTFFTEKPSSCDCKHLDPDTLKQKLQQILLSLQHEIDLRTQQLEQQRLRFKQSLQEKDDIIQRLVEANSILSEENQELVRVNNSDRQYLQVQLSQYQQSLAAQKKQLNAIINYLELKNQQLSRRLNGLTSANRKTTTKQSQVFQSCLINKFSQQQVESKQASTTNSSTLKKVSSANYLLPHNFYHVGHSQSDVKNPNLRHLKKSRLNFDRMQKNQHKSRASNHILRNFHTGEWEGSRLF